MAAAPAWFDLSRHSAALAHLPRFSDLQAGLFLALNSVAFCVLKVPVRGLLPGPKQDDRRV
jgi:hypothetical protein